MSKVICHVLTVTCRFRIVDIICLGLAFVHNFYLHGLNCLLFILTNNLILFASNIIMNFNPVFQVIRFRQLVPEFGIPANNSSQEMVISSCLESAVMMTSNSLAGCPLLINPILLPDRPLNAFLSSYVFPEFTDKLATFHCPSRKIFNATNRIIFLSFTRSLP